MSPAEILEQIARSVGDLPVPGTACSMPGCPNEAMVVDVTLRGTAWCSRCTENNIMQPPKILAQSYLNRIAQDLHDLREALHPFAAFAALLPPVEEGRPRPTDSGPAFTCGDAQRAAIITFQDLRRARDLLERLDREEREQCIQFAEERMRR